MVLERAALYRSVHHPRSHSRRGAPARIHAGVYSDCRARNGGLSIDMKRTLLIACLCGLAACAARPTATLRHPPPAPGTAHTALPATTPEAATAAATVAEESVEASALEAFPTRVFTSDAIVTVHSPELMTTDDAGGPQLRTAVDVYVDADSQTYSGTALVPASIIAVDQTPALLTWRRDRIVYDFSGCPAGRVERLTAAAGFAFERRPAESRLLGIADRDAIRGLTPLASSRALVIRRTDGTSALDPALRREKVRREAIQRQYERLTTDPRATPRPVTPRQRYFDRSRRFGPVLRPSRGLSRGSIGRR